MAGRVVAVKDANTALARYEHSLDDLTFNSKPLIDDLTRSAEQLEPKGDEIVEMIQRRIMKVRPEWKLPSLYLMDSIMKNLKGSYVDHVGQVIVDVFCHCFEKLTEPDPRKMLYKLRTTWSPYLSKQKLAALDGHIRTLDPKWPVIAVDNDSPTATIFINPKFVEKQEKMQTTTSSIEQRRKAVLQQTKNQRQEQERVMGLSSLSTNKDKDCTSDSNTLEKKKISQNLSEHQHSSRARSTSPLPLTISNTRSHKSASPPHSHHITEKDSKPTSNVSPPAAKRIKVADDSEDDDVTSEIIKEAHLRLDDVPPELLPIHQKKIRERIERQINAGNLTPEQRTTLVGQLNQLYELQKHKRNPSHHHPPESAPNPTLLNQQPVHNVENQGRDFPSHTVHPPRYTSLESRGRAPYRRFGPRHRPYRGRGHTQVNMHPNSWPMEHGEPIQGKQASSDIPPPSLPVGDLIKKLREGGFIGDESKSSLARAEEPRLKIPNLALTPATLKQRYSSVIALLHNGTPCSSCGLRFLDNSGELYKSHLNWHYRINRQEKEGHRTSRNWFIHPDDWFKYEELADDSDLNELKSDHGRLNRESPVTVLSSEVNAEPKPEAGSCSVEAGDTNEVCVVCNEQFDQFWEEEEECWHFRDAIRTNPGGKLCHTFCYKDAE